MSQQYNADLNNMALIPEYDQSKDKQTPININQFQFSENKMIIKEEDSCSMCAVVFVLCIPLTFASIALFISINNFSLVPFLIILSVWVVLLTPIILVLILLNTKIHITKEEFNNILKVQRINSFKCAISTMTFNLKNIIMDVISYQFHSKRRTSTIEALAIVNTFKDMSEIDLDTSTIKDKPVKLYHIIDRIPKKTYDKESLSKFLGISPEFENPLLFNINQYMGKPNEELLKLENYNLSKYMKMSEHFYTFYFEQSCFFSHFMNLSFPLFFEFIYLLITSILFSEMPTIGKIIVIIIDIITIILLLYVFYLFFKVYLRMDIIFSKNFDKLFIALLNRKGSSYKKTFIFDINLIDKFILQPYKDSNKKSFLKVVYKDKNIEELLRIDEYRNNLDGLLFILNQKLDGK